MVYGVRVRTFFTSRASTVLNNSYYVRRVLFDKYVRHFNNAVFDESDEPESYVHNIIERYIIFYYILLECIMKIL